MASSQHTRSGAFHQESPRLDAFLRFLASTIGASGVDSPRLSAEVLLAHALGIEREELLKSLILSPETLLTADQVAAAELLASRRAAGEPVAYITGIKEFYGHRFHVDPSVLIPRPETEMLVDLSLQHINKYYAGREGLFADCGTGSGCIAVSLAKELSSWKGIALDVSPAALALAQKNAQSLEAPGLSFLLADFTSPPLAAHSLDLLLSNPPYISEEEYSCLSREVRCFEPKSALVPHVTGHAGLPGSGLEHAKIILHQAARLLVPGGLLLMEIGQAQASAMLTFVDSRVWSECGIIKDLAGLDRIFMAQKGKYQW